MEKIIIFDFDGVLADSVQAVFKMNEEGVKTILNRELTMPQYLACFETHINQGLTVMYDLTPEEKQSLVSHKAGLFPQYYSVETVKLFDFAKDLVINASALGELWIVSSTPSELITKVLEANGILKYFSKINGQNQQPKKVIFQEALHDKKGYQVFFITDTTGDLKETKGLDMKLYTIAVPWGFHDKNLLLTEYPDCMVNDSKDIIDFINTK